MQGHAVSFTNRCNFETTMWKSSNRWRKGAFSFGFVLLSFVQIAVAEVTCQDNDPSKLCCQQWRMEVFGPGGKDVLLDNSYTTLISERDHRQRVNQRWCSQEDRNFCGITFGAPQCWGNPVSPPPNQAGLDAQCNSMPLGQRELCRRIGDRRAKCQRACTQWDTVNGQWVCFAYGPPPAGCPRSPNWTPLKTDCFLRRIARC